MSVCVTAPVRWRNANQPQLHSRSRKAHRHGRLRLLNAGADSFNNLLAQDIGVSSRSEAARLYSDARRAILLNGRRGRTLAFTGVQDAQTRRARARFAAGPP